MMPSSCMGRKDTRTIYGILHILDSPRKQLYTHLHTDHFHSALPSRFHSPRRMLVTPHCCGVPSRPTSLPANQLPLQPFSHAHAPSLIPHLATRTSAPVPLMTSPTQMKLAPVLSIKLVAGTGFATVVDSAEHLPHHTADRTQAIQTNKNLIRESIHGARFLKKF